MTSLLPESSGIFEKALEATHAERWSRMNAAVPAITTAKETPPPSFLPYLVWEYGLGMLTPYVGNIYDLIDEGVDWLRIRGTYAGVEMGLGFVGVTATVEPAWHGRVWWNSSQLRFPVLPANDAPLLERIEGITKLSLPFRSDLRRGVHEYDIPPAEADGTLLDGSLLEEESGIRLPGGSTVWSFGRTSEFEHTLTRGEGGDIGNWVDVPENGGLSWSEMNYPWSSATFAWTDSPDAQRQALMAAWFNGRKLYLKMMDGNGDVLGYRRVKSSHSVAPDFNGSIVFDGVRYSKSLTGQLAYVEAMIDFEDFDGVDLRSIALVSDVVLAPGVKPGKLLLAADDVTKQVSYPAGRFWMGAADFPSFAHRQVNLQLRKTVRECFKFLVRF